MPYVIVGDGAFGLKEHTIKSYPAETAAIWSGGFGDLDLDNCCGILGKRFRILDKRMNLSADKCTNITNVCIVLKR